MNPLAPDLDVAALLRDTATTGAAIAHNALDQNFRRRLEAEVRTGPFEPMERHEGRALQQADLFQIRHDTCAATHPLVHELGAALVHAIHGAGHDIEGASNWVPNEIHIQRYERRVLGITPHLDLKRYGLLIAIATLGATAPFTLCRDREGTVLRRWQADAGSLILLRAPGLSGVEDGRLLHSVSGPDTGTRISITWRMNTRPSP